MTWNEEKTWKTGWWTLALASGSLLTHYPTLGWDDALRAISAQRLVAGSELCRSRAAESKRDFIHKLRIALKELRESRSWIKLILKTDLVPEQRMAPLLDEAEQLCNIVGKSIVTAKANQQKRET